MNKQMIIMLAIGAILGLGGASIAALGMVLAGMVQAPVLTEIYKDLTHKDRSTTSAPTASQTTSAPTPSQTTSAPTPSQTTSAPTPSQTTSAPTPSQTTSKTDLSSISIDSTKSVDYKPLRDALEEHDWGRANYWTTEKLLQAFGNKSFEKGEVQLQETEVLPCDDIKIVNNLWSKASDGKLGFTAQRQVNKPYGTNWEKAYQKMEWLAPDGDWKIKYLYDGQRNHFKQGYYPNIVNPPKGHLPTFERGYNFDYSLDGTLYRCSINP